MLPVSAEKTASFAGGTSQGRGFNKKKQGAAKKSIDNIIKQ